MQHSDSEQYDQLSGMLHRLMRSYGYQRLETPVIQPADLFLTRAGDGIISRLFTFERGGKQLALRPEYTSTALALFCAQPETTVARWQFGGIVFEDAPDTPHQQHYSIGAEVFGLPEPLADAEIIELSLRGLMEAGVPEPRAVIGHVALLRLLISRHVREPRLQRLLLNLVPQLRQADGEARAREQLDQMLGAGLALSTPNHSPSAAVMEALLQPLEQAQLMGGRTREDIQRRLTRKLERAEARPQIEAALGLIKTLLPIEGPRQTVLPELNTLIRGDQEAQALLAGWESILEMAQSMGVSDSALVLAPGLSRNWDYYSGLVFELHGGGKHLGGGGRYDELARLLGSPSPVSAVGFAYYADALLALRPALPDSHRHAWTLSGPMSSPHTIQWLNVLRSNGVSVAWMPDHGEAVVQADGHLRMNGGVFTLEQATRAAKILKGDAL